MVLIEARGGDLVPPPLLFLADPEVLAHAHRDFDGPGLDGAWEAPLGDGLTMTEADALVEELACGARDGEELRWCAGGQPRIPRARTRSGADVRRGPRRRRLRRALPPLPPAVRHRALAGDPDLGRRRHLADRRVRSAGRRRAGGGQRLALVRPSAAGRHAALGPRGVAGRLGPQGDARAVHPARGRGGGGGGGRSRRGGPARSLARARTVGHPRRGRARRRRPRGRRADGGDRGRLAIPPACRAAGAGDDGSPRCRGSSCSCG